MTDTLLSKLSRTEYPRWRNLLSCVFLAVLSTGTVLSWYYLYFTLPATQCHKGTLYLSALWLAVQWVVIGYLYGWRDIPAFARTAIKLLIVVANLWFILFLFSLKSCGS